LKNPYWQDVLNAWNELHKKQLILNYVAVVVVFVW